MKMKKKIAALVMVVVALIGMSVPVNAFLTPVRVLGVTATSCCDTQTVSIEWKPVKKAEAYQLQISRSCMDWDTVDSYTTTGAPTKYLATFNYKSKYRVVDYSECDTYYVRVRAVGGGRRWPWSRPVKTRLVERSVDDNPASHLIVPSVGALENAIDNMNNLYKPTWSDSDD